jgi:hypothetical protein
MEMTEEITTPTTPTMETALEPQAAEASRIDRPAPKRHLSD